MDECKVGRVDRLSTPGKPGLIRYFREFGESSFTSQICFFEKSPVSVGEYVKFYLIEISFGEVIFFIAGHFLESSSLEESQKQRDQFALRKV